MAWPSPKSAKDDECRDVFRGKGVKSLSDSFKRQSMGILARGGRSDVKSSPSVSD